MAALLPHPKVLYNSPEAPALRGKSVGMHSALFTLRRQHYFIASFPPDVQHAVSRLYSGSGVDGKSAVKRIAVHARRCPSYLLVIQGGLRPSAFTLN